MEAGHDALVRYGEVAGSLYGREATIEVDIGQVNLYGSYDLCYQETQQKRLGRVGKSIFNIPIYFSFS